MSGNLLSALKMQSGSLRSNFGEPKQAILVRINDFEVGERTAGMREAFGAFFLGGEPPREDDEEETSSSTTPNSKT